LQEENLSRPSFSQTLNHFSSLPISLNRKKHSSSSQVRPWRPEKMKTVAPLLTPSPVRELALG
jgi:hypothetical protein